jgi:3-hydroxymyristoyl/3-hydroxydecanoyl-(acyl carrier protein) dehydratase
MRDCISAARVGEPRTNAEGSSTVDFRFPPDDPTFAGHFPGRPLLPGVYQLEMARMAAEAVLKCPLAVQEITRAKFSRPIGPTEIVRVELKFAEKPAIIQLRAGLSVNGQPAGEILMQLTKIHEAMA